MDEEQKIKELANEMAAMINKNIRDVTTTITMNIDYNKPHTVLSAFAAVYSVSEYFQFKLGQMGISPDAIQKAKDGADKYVIDVISGDLKSYPIDKGEA